MEFIFEIKEIINPSNTALLVWDVQNMLVHSIFNTDAFLLNANQVIQLAHKKNIPVFYSKITPLPEKYESPPRKFNMKRGTLKLNQEPGGFDLAIKPSDGEMIILKSTASIFIGTNFELILKNAGISTIIISGIATEMGVESTARDAINRGYFSVIISDAVSSFNQEAHKRSLENLKNIAIVLTLEELTTLLEQ